MRQQIEALNREYDEAFNQNDAEAVARFAADWFRRHLYTRSVATD
jgi:hypothetical protein